MTFSFLPSPVLCNPMLLSQNSATQMQQMDPPPSSAAIASGALPTIPSDSSKIRLMCSYGGHIVPWPHRKSLFYAGGDTRIIALDRRTTASSFSALNAHISRNIFNNRPFHLKYQLPNEDLDSLVSVTTDEDLENMVEEHDRVSTVADPIPARIRLFLFPLKQEPIGSALLDRKSDLWFSDALNNTGIIQRGQSTDTGLQHELLGLDCVGGSDNSNVVGSGARSGGGEGKDVIGGVPESLILETSSSFGSTSSSVSMANSPAIGVHYEDNYVGLLEKKTRVPSSASIESDNSVGSANIQLKKITNQDTLIQVANDIGNPNLDQISSGYYISPPLLGQIHHQPYELPYPQQGIPYMNQYTTGPLPPTSYYPSMYQMPVHTPYMINQPYPIYLVPNVAVNQPPLHYHTAIVTPPPPPLNEEVAVSSTTAPFVVPQAMQQCVEPPDQGSETVTVVSNAGSEVDEDIAYTQIYKTQPSAPSLLPPQYQTSVKGMKVLISES